jgi:outer membrane protein assembly factor BamB
MKKLLLLGAALAASLTLPLSAANWPQWRGPDFNGSSPETGLPSSFSKTNNLLWQAPLPGTAGSTPIVWDDSVFITAADAQKSLLLLCLDRKDGHPLWQQEVAVGDRSTHQGNNMASGSPVTDGKTVFALFGTGDIAAYDFSGHQIWARNIAKEYGKFAINWLYGSSPTLYQGKLYVQVIQADPPTYPQALDDKPHRDSYLLCLDPATGKNLWRQIRKTDAFGEGMESYATPIPFESKDGTQILVVGASYMTAHDPATGAEIWRCGGMNDRHEEYWRLIASPATGAGMIFASSPKHDPFIAIREGGKGDITATHTAWKLSDHSPDVCTPLFYQGKLYLLDGDKRTFLCLNPKTGDRKWEKQLPVRDNFKASPTAADGKIYCISERGTVFVLQAGDEFKILSSSELGEGPDRSSIAIAQGALFLQTQKAVYSFGGK